MLLSLHKQLQDAVGCRPSSIEWAPFPYCFIMDVLIDEAYIGINNDSDICFYVFDDVHQKNIRLMQFINYNLLLIILEKFLFG